MKNKLSFLTRLKRTCVLLASISISVNASTDNPMIGTNYLEQLQVSPDISMHSTDVLGDTFDTNSGSFSFTHVDVSLPGNFNLPVEIRRTFAVGESSSSREFGSWGLDLPRIVHKEVGVGTNLPTDGAWKNGNACSAILYGSTTSPESFTPGGKRVRAEAVDYWGGTSLNIPGRYNGKMLAKGEWSNTNNTENGKGRYLANHWWVDCYKKSNGHEGFRVTTNNGDVYYFDVLRRTRSFNLELSANVGDTVFCHIEGGICGDNDPTTIEVDSPSQDAPDVAKFQLWQSFMLPSRIEDKFGNVVNYYYSGSKLTKIEASDGRKIELYYTNWGEVREVIVNNRRYEYSYTDIGPIEHHSGFKWLSSVKLPSGKSWKFHSPSNLSFEDKKVWHDALLGRHKVDTEVSQLGGTCVAALTGELITVEHPDGLKGVFTFKETVQRRTNVPEIPLRILNYGDSHEVLTYQLRRCNVVYSLASKKLTNTDNSEMLFKYDYFGTHGTFEGRTPTVDPLHSGFSGSLPSGITTGDLKTTRVTYPDNSKVEHHFATKFGWMEGKELITDYYDKNGGRLLKRQVQDYVQSAVSYGTSWVQYDKISSHQILPRKTTIIEYGAEGGSTSYYTERSYDSKDNLTLIKESNSYLSGAKYTRYTYDESPSYLSEGKYESGIPTKKIFGFLKKTEVSSNGLNYSEVSRTAYDEVVSGQYQTWAKHWDYEFGIKTKTYSYHTSTGQKGALKRVTLESDTSDSTAPNTWIEYADYKRGKAQKISSPQSLSQTAVHAYRVVDDNGWVKKHTDFEGNVTHFDYDSVGRLKSITPDNNYWNPTTFSFSTTSSSEGVSFVRAGMLKRITTKGNYKKTEYFDGLLRPRATLEEDKTISSTKRYQFNTYNYANNVTFSSYPSTSATGSSSGISHAFDGLQRPISTTQGGASSTTSYLTDNKVKSKDFKGYYTTTQYWAQGSPSQNAPLNIYSPEGVTTSLVYNIYGNPTSITQGGVTQTNVYNTQQKLCKEIRADIGNKAYHYNNYGILKWSAHGSSVDSNNSSCATSANTADKTVFTFGNLRKVRQITYGNGTSTKTFKYDKNGNLLESLMGANKIVLRYNDLNLVDQEVHSKSGSVLQLNYGFDGNGNVSDIIYPTHHQISYAPNGLGQATRVKNISNGANYASNVTHHANGALKSFNYGNGLVYSLQQNSLQLPYEISYKRSGYNQAAYRYSYDNNLNVKSILDLTSSYDITSITYDGLDRIKTAISPDAFFGDATYWYDSLGNITKYNFDRGSYGENTLNYVYNSTTKRLDSVSGARSYSFAYDTRGNVTRNKSGGSTLSYNLANQMEGFGSRTYSYDANDRRVTSTNGTKVNRYLYSQTGTMMHRINDAGKKINYIQLGNQLIAKQETTTLSSRPVLTSDGGSGGGSGGAAPTGSVNCSNCTKIEFFPSGQTISAQMTVNATCENSCVYTWSYSGDSFFKNSASGTSYSKTYSKVCNTTFSHTANVSVTVTDSVSGKQLALPTQQLILSCG